MEFRTSLLAFGSIALTALVISNAFYQKKQFYPSVVHITKSNPCMAVIYLQSLVFVVLLGKVMRRIFFGQLRPSEVEHLIERSWYAVTETCLAFTVFRDDFSPKFVAVFTILLFVKCFHWLTEDRVDYMERSPVITILFHARMMGLIALLSAMDSYFISHAYFSTLLRGASVQLVFGFEYAILLTTVFMISVKYILHTVDLRTAHPWESKAVYLLYSELVLDFVRVILYSIFMIVMMKLHTFPLFSVRPMYLTIRSFKKVLNDVIMSRRAISYMDNLYPDVSPEQLSSGDAVCIICREEMVSGAKKLPCGHVFHTACLRSWFQRQQTCPTCRLDILQMPLGSTQAPAGRPEQHVPAPPEPAPPNQQQRQNAAQFPGFPFFPQNFRQPQINGSLPNQRSSQEPGSNTQSDSSQNTQGPFVPSSAFFPGSLPQQFIPPSFFHGSHFPMPSTMPFVLPFPSVPDFAALTNEEVAAMEGVERAAVEQRIRCLRNIQTLLEAATVQLQQYLSVLSVLSLPSSQSNSHLQRTIISDSTASPESADQSDETLVHEELRQRRLRHFHSTQSNNAES